MSNPYWLRKKSLCSFSPCDCLCNNSHNDKNIFSIFYFFWNKPLGFIPQTEMFLETGSSGSWKRENESNFGQQSASSLSVNVLKQPIPWVALSWGSTQHIDISGVSPQDKPAFYQSHSELLSTKPFCQTSLGFVPCGSKNGKTNDTHQNKINIWDFGVVQWDASSYNVRIFIQNNTHGKTRQGMCQYNCSLFSLCGGWSSVPVL